LKPTLNLLKQELCFGICKMEIFGVSNFDQIGLGRLDTLFPSLHRGEKNEPKKVLANDSMPAFRPGCRDWH